MLKLYAFNEDMSVIDYQYHKLIINSKEKRDKIIDKFYKENKHAYRIKVVF